MKARNTLLTLALGALIAGPALAQGNPGAGKTTMGRDGFLWQTDIDLAKEELKEFQAELDRMTEEEWMAAALAWVSFDYAEERQLMVDDSYRVDAVDPGKKAEVEEITFDPPTWGIAWSKKSPRKLVLTLTDDQSTEIDCALGAAEKLRSGFMGIFLRDNIVVCMPRGPFSGSDDEEPAA